MFKLIAFSIIFIVKFSSSDQRVSENYFVNCRRINTSFQVDVDILYEALCPDSLNFIEHQLLPAWKDIKDYVNLNLVPFGKSTVGVIFYYCDVVITNTMFRVISRGFLIVSTALGNAKVIK